MDCVIFPQEDDEGWTPRKADPLKDLSQISGESRPQRHVSELDAAFKCTAAMLSAPSLESSVRGVLRHIGEYYRADRVYTLILSQNRKEVSLHHEWDSRGKNSIRQTALGLRLEKMPALTQCRETGRAVFLQKPSGNFNDVNKYWNFIVCPMEEYRQITGFLCVENPKAHVRSSCLVEMVTPYLMNEPQRFRRQDVSPKGAASDPLNMLPNLKDYEKAAYALNSDNYSTMGALVVGVSDPPSLNASRGFEYGQELLTYVLEVLTGIFDRRYIYCIWDSEFAVLLPDTIQNVFNARCLRLKTRLSRRYPGLIKTGYTWSDGIFNARALIKEAKNLMKCDTLPSPESSSQFWREISVPVSIKRYIPYYQPKVDMRSGSLIGAEAVVRSLGDDGNIIMPGEFIEALEKNGGIRELDFFMMENVMRQLKQWQEKGYALLMCFLPLLPGRSGKRPLLLLCPEPVLTEPAA